MKNIFVQLFIAILILLVIGIILTLPNGYVNKGEKRYPKVKMCPCDTTDEIRQIY